MLIPYARGKCHCQGWPPRTQRAPAVAADFFRQKKIYCILLAVWLKGIFLKKQTTFKSHLTAERSSGPSGHVADMTNSIITKTGSYIPGQGSPTAIFSTTSFTTPVGSCSIDRIPKSSRNSTRSPVSRSDAMHRKRYRHLRHGVLGGGGGAGRGGPGRPRLHHRCP